MDKMIAFCGIHCSECPVYLVTQKNSDVMREKVLKLWSKQYNMELSIEDINCQGCKTDGNQLFAHCKKCDIRSCAQEKRIDSCIKCNSYPCKQIEDFFSIVPIARDNLEKLRRQK
jgi:hypothetical protein